MLLLVDAQVAPALAPWLARTFRVEAIAIRDLGLRDSEDHTIFAEGQRRGHGTVVITKDGDFFDLLQQHGPPPQVVWLRCGNASNAFLRELFIDRWSKIRQLLEQRSLSEQLVSIELHARSGPPSAVTPLGTHAAVTTKSPATVKIALFRRLFAGRNDVFPMRWGNVRTGKSGYAPACANEWKPGACYPDLHHRHRHG